MLTKSVYVLAGGLEEPTFGEILSSILTAISSIFEAFIEQAKTIAYLFCPVDVVLCSGTTSQCNTWVRQHVLVSNLIYWQTDFETMERQVILHGNPLLFIFLCLCIIGLGVTIFRRLANVN